MTVHFHGTPITPRTSLLRLAGRHFCVSFAAPNDVAVCHEIGQMVMLDNGAYSIWKKTGKSKSEWNDYYRWTEKWLEYKTTWAVIPDVIDGGEADNDRLLTEWPHGGWQGAPVWHLDESIDRLLRLCNGDYYRVCFGSSGDYQTVGSPRWANRITEALNALVEKYGKIPVWLHMLRGMAMCGPSYPFASVDSTDVGQNYHLDGQIVDRANRWDVVQCPGVWTPKPLQETLYEWSIFPAAQR